MKLDELVTKELGPEFDVDRLICTLKKMNVHKDKAIACCYRMLGKEAVKIFIEDYPDDVDTEWLYIAVMDYAVAAIRMYKHEFPKTIQADDIENWLSDNCGYKDSTCYWISSKEPIGVYW